MDWSVVMGLGIGLGMPTLGGLAFLVRMESRVTQLEQSRIDDQKWRQSVAAKLDEIASNLNQLIGERRSHRSGG
jgi:hypothetical protein